MQCLSTPVKGQRCAVQLLWEVPIWNYQYLCMAYPCRTLLFDYFIFIIFLFSVCISPFWALPAGRSSGAAAWQLWLCTCSSGRGDVSIFLSDSWLLNLGCFYLSWKHWYELTPLMKIVLLSPSLSKLLEWCLTSVFRCLRSPEQTRLNLKFMYCVWL